MFITVSQVADNGNVIELTFESSHIVTMEPILRRYGNSDPREDRRATGAKTRLEFVTRRVVNVLESTTQIRAKLAGAHVEQGEVCGQTPIYPSIESGELTEPEPHHSLCNCKRCAVLEKV